MSVNNTNLNPAALNSTSSQPAGSQSAGSQSASSQSVGSQSAGSQSAGSQSAGSAGATGKTAHLDPIKISSSSTQSARGADRTDEVQLSSLSSKINELQSGSPEREAFIEGLRLEVASGQYQPSPNEVATKIVDDLLTKSE